jgi:tetratricopeptide (TPR) repeat protein
MRARVTGLVLSSLLLAGAGRAQERPRPAAVSPAQAAVAEGIALLHQNKTVQARERFERALALDPASADAHYMLGWVRERDKDLAAAETEYEAALALAPSRAEIHDRLGHARPQVSATDKVRARRRIDRHLDRELGEGDVPRVELARLQAQALAHFLGADQHGRDIAVVTAQCRRAEVAPADTTPAERTTLFSAIRLRKNIYKTSPTSQVSSSSRSMERHTQTRRR